VDGLDDRAHDICSIISDTTTYPEIEEILPPDVRSPVISRDLARLIARLVVRGNARSILEFGAGTSSLIFARALARVGGGKLTSIEHQPQYSRESWRAVEGFSGVDARLIVAPLRRRVTREGLYWWYEGASETLAARGPFDLVLVDAPPKSFGRDTPLFEALPHLAERAVIVLDDAGRRREIRIVGRWLRSVIGIESLVHHRTFGGRGVAILTLIGKPHTKLSVVNVVESVYEQWVRWRRGRNLPTDPGPIDDED
jgi:predicted O-methyltransferase YrrM